jgi:hypothetical protein
MEGSGRRIFLAVQPGVLEGALARLLSARCDDEVVQAGRRGLRDAGGGYDAAVISDQLPDGVQADVVITLPDIRGNGGTGTVRSGEVTYDVGIAGPERVVELLEQYAPRHRQT